MTGRSPALWGDAGKAVPAADIDALGALLGQRFAGSSFAFRPPVDWRTVAPPAPRLRPPGALDAICSSEPDSRLLHATGRSYTDLVRARRGEYGRPPDVVATPRSSSEVADVLAWAAQADACVVPFGGGTSVVGGVNAPAGDRPVITLQTRAMDRVLEVDAVSRAARIQGGASGPVLEDQLRPSGLTLRFYPQSFEYSTLGGWIATRAGGHYATRLTHIDDVVQSVTAITPAGQWSSARLPASGAGPSPDRLLLGSEGTLGIITEAWVRLQRRPEHRAAASVRFPDFVSGSRAVRDIVQAGLDPASCRLLDAEEALLNGAGDGSAAVLVLGFESAYEPVDHLLTSALGVCRDHRGQPVAPRDGDGGRSNGTADPAAQWRNAFVQAPYLRDALIGLGAVVETFETATTWDRFETLVDRVRQATADAVREVCGDGLVTCRITHAYPDGAAPYFTVIAPARRGSEVAQWAAIKAAAAETLAATGGTITHHHAVGRDHRPWYDAQRPEPFAAALAAAKHAVDPGRILNPGVLVD